MNIFSLIFGKDKEQLIEKFVGFEERAEQIQMAKALEKALLTKGLLIVEAGTGVGKSLAYLLPLIKWVVTNKTKTVVSTYTKTLQEQLVKKDLPFLKNILALNFQFALCLGSDNYLCLRKLHQYNQGSIFETKQEKEELLRIREWFKHTQAGLRSELDFSPTEFLWSNLCRQSDLCLGKKCLYRKDCFYYKARIEMYKADILVTNHHLFFTHLTSLGRVLPHFDAVVFDEAHTLEDVATNYLGIEVSNSQIKYFLDSLFNPQSDKGFLSRVKGLTKNKIEQIKKNLKEAREAADLFFLEVASKFGNESKSLRIREKEFINNYLEQPLKELTCLLEGILKNVLKQEDEIQIKSFISQAQQFRTALELIIHNKLADYVYWIEILNRPRATRFIFNASPINIAAEFKKRVLDEIKPIILTSATLSTNREFTFIKKRLGIDGQVDELILDSPFDYAKNVLLYLPKILADPNAKPELYQDMVVLEIKKILGLMRGRTFVLFTNYKMLDKTHKELEEYFLDLHILKQGQAPRYKLLEIFKHKTNAVLLATNTFWQGIDIPGKALECVIITKLPFAVPDEPVIEAKMEMLIAQNKNPFIHYQLPLAVIMLRQGFGRLIRTQEDRGMVAILDPRVKTRFYGENFIKALPKCRLISDLSEAENFFAEEPK